MSDTFPEFDDLSTGDWWLHYLGEGKLERIDVFYIYPDRRIFVQCSTPTKVSRTERLHEEVYKAFVANGSYKGFERKGNENRQTELRD